MEQKIYKTVENATGIIRRVFPKETNFDSISADELAKAEFWLNNRPRKCFDYFTHQDVFNSNAALPT
jgi:IS30 family transposase